MENKYLKRLLIVVWLVIAAMLGFYLPTIPFINKAANEYLAIKEVKILGTEKLPENAIKGYLATQNWFFLDKNGLKNYLLNFSFIKEVEIEKNGIGKLVIKVKERKPIGWIKINDEIYLVGDDGKLIDTIYYPELKMKDLPFVVYNDEVFEPSKIKLVKKLERSFGENFKIKKYIIYKSRIIAILDNENNTNLIFNVDNIDKGIKKVKEFANYEDINSYKSIDFSFQSSVIGRR